MLISDGASFPVLEPLSRLCQCLATPALDCMLYPMRAACGRNAGPGLVATKPRELAQIPFGVYPQRKRTRLDLLSQWNVLEGIAPGLEAPFSRFIVERVKPGGLARVDNQLAFCQVRVARPREGRPARDPNRAYAPLTSTPETGRSYWPSAHSRRSEASQSFL